MQSANHDCSFKRLSVCNKWCNALQIPFLHLQGINRHTAAFVTPRQPTTDLYPPGRQIRLATGAVDK